MAKDTRRRHDRPTGRPKGRPSKFDAHKAGLLLSALREGLFLSDAAALVRLDRGTVARWIERGKREGDEPFAKFAADVGFARAEFLLLSLRKIRGGEDGTKGIRWVLERLRPRQYGDRVQVHVERSLDEIYQKLQGGLPTDVFQQVLAILSAEAGAGDAGDSLADELAGQ